MSLWERLTGKVVDADGLGQKKRAAATGIIAFDGPVGDLNLEIAINSHPWLQNSAATSLLLAVWAGQALQDMAATLESSAQRQLGEEGKLPEATFNLASHLYDTSLQWIGYGQMALAAIDGNPDFQLPFKLPVSAPRIEWVADAHLAHFVATIAAVGQLGTSVEDALNKAEADRTRLASKYDGAFHTITGSMKLARAKLDQVQAAASDRQAVRLSQDMWAMLQDVVGVYFLAGQQVARPGIIDQRYDAAAQAAARAKRLPPPPGARQAAPGSQPPGQPQPGQPQPGQPQPGQQREAGSSRSQAGPARPPVQAGGGSAPRTAWRPAEPAPPPPPPPTLGQRLGLGFDAWALTDPAARSLYQNDPARIAELEAFWRADPHPAETYRLFDLIADAVRGGKVALRPNEFTRACPWTPTFAAMADGAIGSEKFKTGQLFILKVGMERSVFARGFDRLGFLPGTGPARPSQALPGPGRPGQERPGSAAVPGPPRIDTTRHGDRKAAAPGAGSAAPQAADIWLITAAFQRPQRRASKADTDKISQLWRADPDPGRTVRLHDETIAAVKAGSVRQNGDESLRECPWSQVYVAVNPVTIGGVQLGKNEKFAIEASLRGGAFRLGILRLGSIRVASAGS